MENFEDIRSDTINNDGKFVVKKITKLNDLAQGATKELPESDLTIQTDQEIIQLQYIDNESEKPKNIIKPGCFILSESPFGVILKNFHLRKYELLETIDNTSIILKESDRFFNRLHVWEELQREPKRSLLLYSIPGVGKTSSINKVCETFLKQEGTAVIIWDTADIGPSDINRFFLQNSTFDAKTKRLIFIIEDIGGGVVEDYSGAKGVSSSLLNLLDGVGDPFKGMPTLILATTNNPDQTVSALIDRPGRFDKVIQLKTPDRKQAVDLLKFIAKRELSASEVEAAALAAKNEFSIAHLQEIVVRSMIDEITMLEATEQLVEHKDKFKESFNAVKPAGIGFGNR